MERREAEQNLGFSLMELLVALVILALIIGLVVPRVIGYLGRARTDSAAVQIANIKAALNLYLIDVRRYPTIDEGLGALVTPPSGVANWRGPYLEDGKLPLDPWGRSFHYEPSTDQMTPRVYTLGADNAPGGEAENSDIG